MEHETQQQGNPSNPTADQNAALINSFIEITSSSKEEALFFLESHQWDLDASVSTFFDSNSTAVQQPRSIAPPVSGTVNNSPTSSPSDSADYSPSQSPSRSRSPSPAHPSCPLIRLGRAATLIRNRLVVTEATLMAFVPSPI
ncbi:plant UBX domain-containing protein 5-like [Hibiscus syriacus]|uniref:plant UBX domain-containing protein 5-like n=1 Tax=Hibiscus syriacus TaxID=106335 RepID=UPI0019215B5B|nr:plant UBX domain-containing protein 5-like [Hibiscus syriacus]